MAPMPTITSVYELLWALMPMSTNLYELVWILCLLVLALMSLHDSYAYEYQPQ